MWERTGNIGYWLRSGPLPEVWGILSKITWKRAINAVKLLSGFYWSRLLGRPVMHGMPFGLSVEPTTHCNLRCPHCPSGLRSFTRPTGMIDMSLFKNIIDDLHEDLTYLTLYFQGEPYLHPRFTDLVQYASKRNIYTSASTNGHHLNGENAVKTVRSGLDKLIISIDGMEQNTYERYRIGGRLDRVLKGIDTLIDAKSKLGSVRPFIEAQFIVFGHNEHETALFTRMCRARGIKASIKTAQLYPHQDWEAYLPTNARYSRYERGSSGEMVVKNKLLNHCWRMWYSSVVTWDGSVVPCCFDKDASHSMGNVGEASFAAVWRGAAYDNFRRALLKGRKHIDICRNCTEGTRVWS